MPWAPLPSPARWRSAGCAAGLSGGLEHAGLERMALEQAVELGAVPACQARRLGDVAAGDLEDAHQVVALEGFSRLVERRERGVAGVERLAHQRFRNHLG